MTIIDFPAANQVRVDSNFSEIHYGTWTIRVANLTRNIMVRSSSTYTEDKQAYIRNLATNTTSFSLNYGEFAHLGVNAAGKHGIHLGDYTKGHISSCTMRSGYAGIYLLRSSSNTIYANNLYANAFGLYLDSYSNGNELAFNHIHSNSSNGIRF